MILLQTPEVCRVYIGSFWDAPLANRENALLLEREKRDLTEELMGLPDNAVVRRINELVKRARSVKVSATVDLHVVETHPKPKKMSIPVNLAHIITCVSAYMACFSRMSRCDVVSLPLTHSMPTLLADGIAPLLRLRRCRHAAAALARHR
jgi:predicted nuclease with RNAse H fold